MEKQLELLATLVAKQMETAQLAQEESEKREKRLTSLLEGLADSKSPKSL